MTLEEANKTVVQDTYAKWGAGELNGENQRRNVEHCIHPDCFVDFSSPIHNTGLFKTYSGVEGFIEWMNNLLENEYPEFTPEFITGPGGRIVVRQSYYVKNNTTGKRTANKVTDYFEWSVQDGKIINGKVYMGNVADWQAVYTP